MWLLFTKSSAAANIDGFVRKNLWRPPWADQTAAQALLCALPCVSYIFTPQSLRSHVSDCGTLSTIIL
jgi:hypothetical protein